MVDVVSLETLKMCRAAFTAECMMTNKTAWGFAST
jgi:hypothetical protein